VTKQAGAGDERCLDIPVENAVGDQPGDDEGPGERDQSDRHGRGKALTKIVGVDLRARQEREDDRGEVRNEDEPIGVRIEAEDVADDDAEPELDQGHAQADLDRDHAGDDERDREDRC
jgi:hypothetical protein